MIRLIRMEVRQELLCSHKAGLDVCQATRPSHFNASAVEFVVVDQPAGDDVLSLLSPLDRRASEQAHLVKIFALERCSAHHRD